MKDGKEHRYWSIVESRRLRDARVAQKTVLYLGEINDTERSAWQKSLEVFDEDEGKLMQMRLFAEDREVPVSVLDAVKVKLSAMELRRPLSWADHCFTIRVPIIIFTR